MIVQSEAYRDAVKLNARESRISGTITLNDSTVIQIGEDDVQKGSLSVTNKCVNNANFAYGAVYCGEMSISLLTQIDRYKLYGAELNLYHELKVDEDTYESTHLGIYKVYEANRKKDVIAIKAYDRMLNFNVDIEESLYDNMYTLFSKICELCGVELATTEEEIQAMPNGAADRFYTLRLDYIETFRDALACMSALTCSFCTINADGQLVVRQWGTEPVAEITNDDWKSGASISDFQTYFYGVKARFIANENYYPYTAHAEFDNGGLLLDLGDNPIVMATQEEKNATIQAIWEHLQTVQYIPFDVTINKADPSFELGDMITVRFPDGGSNVGYVMENTWKWRVGQTIRSLGENPLLMSAKDKAAKSLISFENMQSDNSLVVHTYTNAKDLEVNTSSETLVALFNVSATKDTTPVMVLTVPIEMTCDAYVIVRVYSDDILDESYILRKYLPRGQNFVTWSYNRTIKENARVTYKVTMQLEYFESDYRKEVASRKTNDNATAAVIQAFKDYQEETVTVDFVNQKFTDREKVDVEYDEVPIDTTVTAGTVPDGTIRAAIFASGLAAGENWDGTINVIEHVNFELEPLPFNIREIVNVSKHVPRPQLVPRERVSFAFEPLAFCIRDSVTFDETQDRQIVTFECNDYTEHTNDKVMLRKTYEYHSTDGSIDSGYVAEAQVFTDDKESIESVVILDV